MKKNRFLIYVSILSLAGTGVAYFFLPDSLPLHWNYAGKVDSWGPRWNILPLGGVAYVYLYSYLEWRRLHGTERPPRGPFESAGGDAENAKEDT